MRNDTMQDRADIIGIYVVSLRHLVIHNAM